MELDAISKLSDYQIFLIEANEIERWICLKVYDLKKIENAKKIKGVEAVRHQLTYFRKVIQAFSQRIQNFNSMARQLLQHPKSQEIETKRVQINDCWAEYFARANSIDDSVPISAICEKFQPLS